VEVGQTKKNTKKGLVGNALIPSEDERDPREKEDKIKGKSGREKKRSKGTLPARVRKTKATLQKKKKMLKNEKKRHRKRGEFWKRKRSILERT